MRSIPTAAIDLVAKLEGFRANAYPDPATGGDPWTIGYGRAHGVQKGDTVTKAKAREWLADDLQTARAKLYSVLSADDIEALTSNQYAALLSFAYNVGVKAGWSIWKRIKAKQYDQVPAELLKFVNAAGKKNTGLVNRRTEEIRVWSKDEPGSSDAVIPTAITQLDDTTPPTPADPVPPQKSGTILTLAAGSVATVPVAANQVMAAVSPYADKSEVVQKIISVLAVAAACAVVAGLVLAWLKKRRDRN